MKATSAALKCKYLPAILICFNISTQAMAQSGAALRGDDFRDVIITAGYSTLFGAATGTALLPFLSGTPSDNLRFIAGGASVGFMVGSVFGFMNLSQNKMRNVDINNDTNGNNENDNKIYSSSGEYENEQSSVTCKNATYALINSCGSNLYAAIPSFIIAPNALTIPLLNLKF